MFAANQGRLTLVYGANGTGKTTLLRMLFDGLSPARNRGHRTALGQLRFRSFVVEFANGDTVEYTRPDASEGPFAATVGIGGSSYSWSWRPDEPPGYEIDTRTGGLRAASVRTEEAAFLEALASLGVNPVFLTDSRVLISDLVEPSVTEERLYYPAASPGARYVDQIVRRERDADLSDALRRVHEYLRRAVLTGTRLGSERADTVYASVAEAIVAAPAERGRPPKSTIPDLQERVRRLDARIATFTRYNLISALPASRLLDALARAEPRQGRLLHQVLTPYLDGLEERMDGLEPGRGAIAGYVDTINSFFEGKVLDFAPTTGVVIASSSDGEQLEPSDLSSGEKQILVLFSDVVALRDKTRLFIIDEPELSLNPSWQRKLMPSFLASTDGSPMQLLSATHSIEIMAKYRGRLVPLDSDS